MGSYYSILRFVNNSLSEESIAVGLVVLSESNTFFKLSQRKLKIARRLSPQSAKLFDFSVKQFGQFISSELVDDSFKLIKFQSKFDLEYLSRLSKYNNGILQFSKPNFIQLSFDENLFIKYFEKLIGIDEISKPQKESPQLKRNIEKLIQFPLRDKVDINYVIHRKSLPSLFFDFHFDAIGVNGSLIGAHSIDFNAFEKSHPIERTLTEYESVIDRLHTFADKKGIKGKHKFYLITDPYLGDSAPLRDMYSYVLQSKMPHFKVIESRDSKEFTDLVLAKNAQKISLELFPTDSN